MSDSLYTDLFGESVVLTDNVKAVILAKHPEVATFLDRVSATLLTPDEIRRSVTDERVVLYYRYETDVMGGKWVVVVVKQIDRHYISTIYATDRIKSGEILWKK